MHAAVRAASGFSRLAREPHEGGQRLAERPPRFSRAALPRRATRHRTGWIVDGGDVRRDTAEQRGRIREDACARELHEKRYRVDAGRGHVTSGPTRTDEVEPANALPCARRDEVDDELLDVGRSVEQSLREVDAENGFVALLRALHRGTENASNSASTTGPVAR